jgi:hypothetical protein
LSATLRSSSGSCAAYTTAHPAGAEPAEQQVARPIAVPRASSGEQRASASKFVVPVTGGRKLGFIGRSLADAGETLHGSLAELRLWSRDLSLDEILDSKDRRLTGDEPDLAAYWPLHAVADGRLPDRSGRGRSARPVDAAPTLRPGLSLAQPRASSPALRLQGGATIKARNDAPRLESWGLTVQAWVRPHSLKAGACVAELGDADGTWSLALTTERDGGLMAVVREKGALIGRSRAAGRSSSAGGRTSRSA